MFAAFNIEASHHWRDLGIMLGITAFNVSSGRCGLLP
jgi:ATP-binding cassette subfamily G (WHITE) protein 2 (SNQ2)